MAKTRKFKSASQRKRKQRRPNVPNYTGPSNSPVVAKKASSRTPSRTKATAAVPPKRQEVDFASEYHYVVSDLRKMVVVTGIMVVTLLVLNFLAV
ncbi:MAG: hypothetical protein GXP37_12070 [Chloroflexi bacterium]|nr:hypothetical protein [Chloroflexota bacterium]